MIKTAVKAIKYKGLIYIKAGLPIKKGICPWCSKKMEIGDEDPVLERICDKCAELTPEQLKKLNPKMWVKYEKARDKRGHT